jgi:hypothetical protein
MVSEPQCTQARKTFRHRTPPMYESYKNLQAAGDPPQMLPPLKLSQRRAVRFLRLGLV